MPILTETIEQTFALNFNLDMIAEQAYKDHILIMDFLEKRDAVALKSAVTIHCTMRCSRSKYLWKKMKKY